MKVHFNAYFYGEMTFILVNSETSKRQEKQLFANWWPVILKTKGRNGLSAKYNLPQDGREV